MTTPTFTNDYLINEGLRLLDAKEYKKVFELCDAALSTNPENLVALNYKGMVHLAKKEYDEAFEYLDKAYKINPKEKYIVQNRIAILASAGKTKEVEEAYAELDEELREDNYSLGTQFHAKLHINDWTNYYEDVEKIKDAIGRGKKASVGFASGYYFDNPFLQTKANSIWIQNNCKDNPILGPIPKLPRKPKIRLGYFSADYCRHVCMNVLPHLFEVHDRERFEVYAFNFSPTRDEMTERVEKAFDKFFNVTDKSYEDIAKLSREHEIDIAIDLNGLTGGGRPDIFAMRAAPIQINYLGCPGSMPCGYIDYMVADHTLIPSDSRMYYNEKIIYLPDTYQPNDRTRKISDRVFTRAELNLPSNCFIFASFCSVAKLTPPIFDIWMDILKQVPNSVLWLKKDVEDSVKNLKKEAKARGVSEGRLVFAEPVGPGDEFMKMVSMADLFLDTWPFNAHATASDALWAGLPVVSLMGESFPARVSSSILYAAWLPELVTKNKEEYRNLILELARNPMKLRVIRSKLERNRMVCPLFNTELHARYLEAAYISVYERYQANLPKDHIYVRA